MKTLSKKQIDSYQLARAIITSCYKEKIKLENRQGLTASEQRRLEQLIKMKRFILEGSK